jgi:LysR family hca operon transcriptional activator
MGMELRHLRYFIAVAEEQSFTKAAQRLHTAQPSLSQQIRHLENFIGAPLFERNKRAVQLTGSGRVLLREAREVVARIDSAVELAQRAATTPGGELSIGTSPVAEINVLPRIVPLIAERLPDIRLAIHSLSPPAMFAGLRSYSIDAGFLWGPVREPDLATDRVFDQPILVALPSKHKLAHFRRVPPAMLKDLAFITPGRSRVPALHQLINGICTQAGVRLNPVQEADTVLCALNMVASGLGIGLMPEYVRSILPKGVVLRELDWDFNPVMTLVLVYRKNDSLPSLGAFRKLLQTCFA